MGAESWGSAPSGVDQRLVEAAAADAAASQAGGSAPAPRPRLRDGRGKVQCSGWGAWSSPSRRCPGGSGTCAKLDPVRHDCAVDWRLTAARLCPPNPTKPEREGGKCRTPGHDFDPELYRVLNANTTLTAQTLTPPKTA